MNFLEEENPTLTVFKSVFSNLRNAKYVCLFYLRYRCIFTFKVPAGNCMFKVNNRNTRTRCEICSKLTIKTPERR